MLLHSLPDKCPAIILSIAPENAALEAALREVGFAEEDEVEVLHRGAFGRKPICVRLNQTLIALREDEAAAVSVKVI